MIGAGNLASHLAPALQNAGHEIVAVYSRTRLSAEGLAGKMVVPAIVNLEQMSKADVYVFSVRDDVLQTLVDHWCPQHPEALFLHTAGVCLCPFLNGWHSVTGLFIRCRRFPRHEKLIFSAFPVL